MFQCFCLTDSEKKLSKKINILAFYFIIPSAALKESQLQWEQ